MKHSIDPKVDCVFKALLGAVENSNLLIEFLNAILETQLPSPIVSVEILNPYNEREYLSDKLSVVDVKAQDSEQRLFQVEIQLAVYGHLPARILYNWADIYSQQLKSGQNYHELKATYAIWLLNQPLYADSQYWHHFQIQDDNGRPLIDHCHINLLELPKFHADVIANNQQRWLQFFKVGDSLNDEALPDWMKTDSMRQAMTTLSRFSEKDREYFAYQARQEYLRVQSCIDAERETLEQEKKRAEQQFQESEKKRLESEQKRLESEQKRREAEQREQAALAEIEHLKALLAQQNKD